MSTVWISSGKPDVGLTLNGVLAGLVGITAGAASIPFGLAIVTGLVAGVIMVGSVRFFEGRRIDDPVGAISAHGTAGLWGLVAVALFSTDTDLVPQLVGAGTIIAWAFGTSYLVFKVIDVLIGMRVSAAEEIMGLDQSEHGKDAYPEFIPNGVNGSSLPVEVGVQ